MKIIELFSGTQSIRKEAKGHTVLSIEFNPIFVEWGLDQWTVDISNITANEIIEKLGGRPDVVWASPPCTTHSVAAIGRHRMKGADKLLHPKTLQALEDDILLEHTLELIRQLAPALWFIENPRGGMRKSPIMQRLKHHMHTVTYCQYGDTRMKPTDLWTNHPNPKFKPACKNGDPCHESAPRGSRTGTQGLKGDIARGVIPPELCRHIIEISEEILCTY